ncbi:MAG: RecX family transcriptional regulator [Spirochaetes bacterium]|nr:RecX family transcriptional regulator [Spirochaetota bacterium]
MEEREPEEGFSSQSVNAIVTEIKERGAFIGIILSNGSSFFILAEDFSNMDVAPLRSGTDAAIERRGSGMDVASLRSGTGLLTSDDMSDVLSMLTAGGRQSLTCSLEKPLSISAELLEKIEFLHNVSVTYKKAMDILSFAPTTAFLLKQKLLKRGFKSIFIGKAIEKLSEKKMIDDKKFAEGWVSLRMSKNPQAPVVLKAALMKKGVERQVAEEVLEGFTPGSSIYIEGFEKALSKQRKKTGRTLEKIRMSLLRKGYSISLINKYLGEVFYNAWHN